MTTSKKERIIHAAAELFVKHGYASTSIRQIAQRADVATGLLYNYYDGKEDLLRNIFLNGLSRVRSSFEKAENMPSGNIISNLAVQSFKLVKENLEFWRLFYSIRMQPAVLRTVQLDLTEWTGYVMEQLVRYFKAAKVPDPEAEAQVLFSVIDGISQHYAMAPNSYPFDNAVSIIERTFDYETH